MERRVRHKFYKLAMTGRKDYMEVMHTDVYLGHLEDARAPEFEKVCRLKGTNGWVVRDRANGTVCCQSYATIVAMKAGNTAVDFGSWSVSTTRHQGLFRDWCREHPEFE